MASMCLTVKLQCDPNSVLSIEMKKPTNIFFSCDKVQPGVTSLIQDHFLIISRVKIRKIH